MPLSFFVSLRVEIEINKFLVTGAGSGTTIRAVIRRARYCIELRMAEALQGALSPENFPECADAVPADGFFVARSIVNR